MGVRQRGERHNASDVHDDDVMVGPTISESRAHGRKSKSVTTFRREKNRGNSDGAGRYRTRTTRRNRDKTVKHTQYNLYLLSGVRVQYRVSVIVRAAQSGRHAPVVESPRRSHCRPTAHPLVVGKGRSNYKNALADKSRTKASF